MTCTQKKQLVCFPKVRVMKQWFRTFNNDKTFHNEGTLHLFSLMALYSYANFRSNTTKRFNQVIQEAPGQWTCKLGALPRILRVHSKEQAADLMDYFQENGFLTYKYLDPENELLQFSICDWRHHCTNLNYNYYSYKGSGFFFFPLPEGRKLIARSRRQGEVLFSQLDAIMDMWLHTILNDPSVSGSEAMPVVYFANMKGKPLLSYSYLADRWGWSKSRVGRFILKLEEEGLISRISFAGAHGSVISVNCYREMIFGDDGEEIEMRKMGEILQLANVIEKMEEPCTVETTVEKCVPLESMMFGLVKPLKIQVLRRQQASFFSRQIPMIFYTGLDCSRLVVKQEQLRKRSGDSEEGHSCG